MDTHNYGVFWCLYQPCKFSLIMNCTKDVDEVLGISRKTERGSELLGS